ncbi:hypothetical protein [Halococcus sp. PRR34]|uniref:hypothetical protein n=1 Tax=Halococcus sp. PRR34 TaxID=3020830 RepID=UPI002362BE22|nr:hypothetical protein [Halococcus sp. PRR34]
MKRSYYHLLLGRILPRIERGQRVRVVGHPPELANCTSDEWFWRLRDTGVLNGIAIGGCIGWWVIVLEPVHTNVVAAVGMFAPTKIHSLRIRVVEFVVVTCRPLDVESCGLGSTETVIKPYFERIRIEKVVQLRGCERLLGGEHVTNSDQGWPVNRPSERMRFIRLRVSTHLLDRNALVGRA